MNNELDNDPNYEKVVWKNYSGECHVGYREKPQPQQQNHEITVSLCEGVESVIFVFAALILFIIIAFLFNSTNLNQKTINGITNNISTSNVLQTTYEEAKEHDSTNTSPYKRMGVFILP